MYSSFTNHVTRGAAAALVFAFVPSRADAQINTLPPELRDVGVDEHLNAPVPLDGMFRDERGRIVQLSQYFDGRRPVVLDLGYYRCPMLCSMVFHALINGLRETPWTVGNQFDVVSISIDPREGAADATDKKRSVIEQYGRPGTERGWHFLTGDDSSIHHVADAVGYHYRFDRRQGQYAHAAAIMLLTPSAHVARYLYGIEYRPTDVRVGLLEASQGRSISTVERVILFCYHYDPQGRRYVIVAMHVMQVGGAITGILLLGFLSVLWLRERTRHTARRDRRPPTPLETSGAKATER